MEVHDIIDDYISELNSIVYTEEELENIENELIKDDRFQEYISSVKWW